MRQHVAHLHDACTLVIPGCLHTAQVFRYVLQYLRAVRTAGTPLVLPESATERALLRAEADYYGLPGLAELCTCYRGTGAANVHTALGSSAAGAGSSSTGMLASCMQNARRLWAAKEVEWAASAQLLGLKDLLLGHVLEAPLEAQQVDLIKALAQPEPGTCIEVSLQVCATAHRQSLTLHQCLTGVVTCRACATVFSRCGLVPRVQLCMSLLRSQSNASVCMRSTTPLEM